VTVRTLGLSLAAGLLFASFAFAVPHKHVGDRPFLQTGLSQPIPAVDLDAKVSAAGFTAGSPVMIRIFKRESELELWIRKDNTFQLYASYPICFWSGKLGPKQREGDRQAPEGFYSISLAQLRAVGRHPRSLNIGYPNTFDRALRRTGSYILVHGGCTSVGCFAMTDPIMEEIYGLSARALGQGQDRISVHIFPFRMTEENLAPYMNSRWHGFWRNLKDGYDAFEASQAPPNIRVCRGRYVINPTEQPGLAPLPENAAPEDCAPEPPVAIATPLKPRQLLVRHPISKPRLPIRLSGYSGRAGSMGPVRSRIATRVRPASTLSTVLHKRVR
jgi:murein L,D-transpeptidase YafK